MIKLRAKDAGLAYTEFSGHSLRAGLATAAAQVGVSERVIAKQTGHKSLPVLRGYIREGSLFTENPAAKWCCRYCPEELERYRYEYKCD